MRQVRRRTAEQNQRMLLLLTASAAGGKAVQKVWRMLEREQKELAGGRFDQAKEQGCETPLNQEDFERMMREDED